MYEIEIALLQALLPGGSATEIGATPYAHQGDTVPRFRYTWPIEPKDLLVLHGCFEKWPDNSQIYYRHPNPRNTMLVGAGWLILGGIEYPGRTALWPPTEFGALLTILSDPQFRRAHNLPPLDNPDAHSGQT